MKRGQRVIFSDLNSPIQLKQLNDTLNRIIERLDELYKSYETLAENIQTDGGETNV